MTYRAEILLGKIIKSFGFEGALTVKTEKIFNNKILEMGSVFLEIEGKPVPFIIDRCEVVDDSLIRLTFNGYDSFEKISKFIGCRVFLTSEIELDNSENDLHQLEGYQIYESGNNLLGTVMKVIENPGQVLLAIRTSLNNEILVPLHQDFIISFDKKKKIILMDLPDGLTEVNQ